MKTFALGADDPEMSAIECLLRQAGQKVYYAATEDGRRVTPATAYTATSVVDEKGNQFFNQDGALLLVECDFPTAIPAGRCDHHRPGDGGYGKPPAEFWQASSVGQVCALVGVEPTPELLMVAAADHCLAAAYAGQCPGVDPAGLAEFRIRQRAEFQKREVSELRAEMEAALKLLREAVEPCPLCALTGGYCGGAAGHPACGCFDAVGVVGGRSSVYLGGYTLADMRGQFVPELREAALIAQLPGYLAEVAEGKGAGQRKLVISAPESAVAAFLEAARVGNVAGTPVHTDGELKPYGDPARGFAGAYIGANG